MMIVNTLAPRTTRKQREALWNLYARAFLTGEGLPVRTYKSFRKTVKPMFFGDGAIVVPWAGMWIAIEPDGYTHS